MISDEQVKTQVEYYLSDKNLEKDAFFYGKILENENGYIDLDLIMNCNKIKSLGVSKERIVEACKNSSEVEINSAGNQIRRKHNKPLPESKFKSKKLAIQLKSEKSATSVGVAKSEISGEAKTEEAAAESNEFIPLILFIKDTSRLEKVIGREFEAKLGEELKIDVPFARIGKYDGNVVFNRAEMTQELLEKLVTKGFEYEGQKVIFEIGTDRDRDEFMRNHGRHVGKIILKSKLF
jgi:La domain